MTLRVNKRVGWVVSLREARRRCLSRLIRSEFFDLSAALLGRRAQHDSTGNAGVFLKLRVIHHPAEVTVDPKGQGLLELLAVRPFRGPELRELRATRAQDPRFPLAGFGQGFGGGSGETKKDEKKKFKRHCLQATASSLPGPRASLATLRPCRL